MNKLADAVALIASEMHSDRIFAICSVLDSTANADPSKILFSSLGASFPARLKERLRQALVETAATAPEVSAMFRGAVAMAKFHQQTSVEMVWTGPSTEIVSTRHTEQVLIDLINTASERLFVVSFVAYHVTRVIEAFRGASKRGVEIFVLLERSKEYGGNVSVDSVALLKKAIPDAKVYGWSKDVALGASVHAKCAVADGKTAFITSANLSDAAMTRNMELGVFIRGGFLPHQLEQHLQALIHTRLIAPV